MSRLGRKNCDAICRTCIETGVTWTEGLSVVALEASLDTRSAGALAVAAKFHRGTLGSIMRSVKYAPQPESEVDVPSDRHVGAGLAGPSRGFSDLRAGRNRHNGRAGCRWTGVRLEQRRDDAVCTYQRAKVSLQKTQEYGFWPESSAVSGRRQGRVGQAYGADGDASDDQRG